MNIPGSKFKQSGAINLYMVSILMMAITLAALSLLYYMRYGHLPLQDVWQRWSKSAEVVTNKVTKELSGSGRDSIVSGQAVTVDAGIRRCTIHGKVVFSDVECSDSNPTTRAVKLVDNKGGQPPKASAASTTQDAAQGDMTSQMIDKAVK